MKTIKVIQELKQGDQLEPTYSNSARIRYIALRTCQKRRTIGRSGERGSVISMLAARDDDDDDDCMIPPICIYTQDVEAKLRIF